MGLISQTRPGTGNHTSSTSATFFTYRTHVSTNSIRGQTQKHITSWHPL
jgi:hypothetical protein